MPNGESNWGVGMMWEVCMGIIWRVRVQVVPPPSQGVYQVLLQIAERNYHPDALNYSEFIANRI